MEGVNQMNQAKLFLKASVLLVLFVCTTVSAYAGDAPPSGVEQKFSVGFKYFGGDGLSAIGVNARFWSESKWGFEGGWARDGNSVNGISTNFDIIPVSVLYTLGHVDTTDVYIHPYVGGGLNITHYSSNNGIRHADFFSDDYYAPESQTKVGGQGFVGAEFTFKKFPKLSFGGDLGIHRNFGDTGFRAGVQVHYYLK